MAMPLSDATGLPQVTLFPVGWCTAPEVMSRRDGSLRSSRFPAGCAWIEHETLGGLLFDAGYGQAFWQATTPFPERFYRWLTPAFLPARQALPRRLPRAPDRIFLSHLHADHVAGLFDLPELPEIFASRSALEGLALGRIASLRAGCPQRLRDRLRGLRIRALEELPLCDPGLPGLPPGYDLAGDGQMIAIPLPGHGIGQTGLWLPRARLNGVTAPVFLVADAIWSLSALKAGAPPPRLTLRQLGDSAAYLRGFRVLRELHLARPEIRLIASHCPDSYPPEDLT